jgi:hypothetical protein
VFGRVAEGAELGMDRRVDASLERVEERDDVGVVRRLEIIRALGTSERRGPAAEGGQDRQRDYN